MGKEFNPLQVISPAAGLVGTLGGAAISSAGAQAANEQMMDFNMRMAKMQNQFNYDLYKEQLKDQKEMYEQYMSPKALAKEYSQLGLNPAQIYGSGVPNSSIPSLPSAAGASGSGVGSLYNTGAPFADVVPATAQVVSQLIDADAQGRKTQTEVSLLMEQLHGQELANNYQKMMNFLQDKYGDDKAAAELKHELSSAYLAYAQGDVAKATERYTNILKFLAENRLKASDMELSFLYPTLTSSLKLLQANQRNAELQAPNIVADTKQKRSQAAVNYANAGYLKALTQTENALRDGRVEMQSLQNDLFTIEKFLRGNELSISDATKDGRISAMMSEFKAAGLLPEIAWNQLQVAEQQAYQASVASDWAVANQYRDYMSTFLNCFSNALGSYAQLRGVNLSRLSAKERNDIQDRFVREMEKSGALNRRQYYGPYGQPQTDTPFGANSWLNSPDYVP